MSAQKDVGGRASVLWDVRPSSLWMKALLLVLGGASTRLRESPVFGGFSVVLNLCK